MSGVTGLYDTVLKKCVSSKVLIFVVNKKNQRKNNEAYK